MAIFEKGVLNFDIEKFKSASEALIKALEGEKPNMNIYNKYALNSEQFENDFVDVNLRELEYAISDFETSIKMLKKVKTHKAKPLHSSR